MEQDHLVLNYKNFAVFILICEACHIVLSSLLHCILIFVHIFGHVTFSLMFLKTKINVMNSSFSSYLPDWHLFANILSIPVSISLRESNCLVTAIGSLVSILSWGVSIIVGKIRCQILFVFYVLIKILVLTLILGRFMLKLDLVLWS